MKWRPQNLRLGPCVGKTAYGTREEAMAVKRQHFPDEGAKVRAYKCPTCKQWHIGHKP